MKIFITRIMAVVLVALLTGSSTAYAQAGVFQGQSSGFTYQQHASKPGNLVEVPQTPPAADNGPKSLPLSTSEIKQVSPLEAVQDFYTQRSHQFATAQAKTYAEQFTNRAFAIFPPTYWQDKIAGMPPYDVEGILFTLSMRDNYETLKASKKLNIPHLVNQALTEVILNTRDRDVARIIPTYERKGDVWYTAFSLVGQYNQLTGYPSKYKDLQEYYAAYQRSKATSDRAMMEYYEKNFDFTPVEQKLDMEVFRQRQADIREFARGFSNGSYAFLSQVIVPMQTDSVAQADVSRYLDAHLSDKGLPQGVSRAQLKTVIMETIASPEDFTAQAEKNNPSLLKQIKRAGKSLFLKPLRNMEDVTNILSLFEYMAPSTYIRMAINMQEGKVTHAQVNQALAEALAAEALDKRLSQIANDLFEVERIFAFPTTSVAEETIEKNWQKLATNDVFSTFMIARLAADNIIKSGKTAYQTNALFQMQLKNRALENARTDAEILLFAADFLPFGGVSQATQGAKQTAKAASEASKASALSVGVISSKVSRGQKETALLAKRGLASLNKGSKGKTAAKVASKEGKVAAELEKGASTVKGAAKGSTGAKSAVKLPENARVATQQGLPKLGEPKHFTAQVTPKAQRPLAQAPQAPRTPPKVEVPATVIAPKADAVPAAQIESKLTGPLDSKVAKAQGKKPYTAPTVDQVDIVLTDDIMSGASGLEPSSAHSGSWFGKLFGKKSSPTQPHYLAATPNGNRVNLMFQTPDGRTVLADLSHEDLAILSHKNATIGFGPFTLDNSAFRFLEDAAEIDPDIAQQLQIAKQAAHSPQGRRLGISASRKTEDLASAYTRTYNGGAVTLNENELVRFKGNGGRAVNQDYVQASKDARRYMIDAVESGEYTASTNSYMETMNEMHRVSAKGESGNLDWYKEAGHGSMEVNPGQIRTGRRPYNNRYEQAQQVEQIAKLYGDPFRVTKTSTVNLAGIPPDNLPINQYLEGTFYHWYPKGGEALRPYYTQMQRTAKEAVELINQEAIPQEIIEKIAEHYQYAANARPYGQINNSLFMNEVNTLLQKAGLRPIPHGELDIAAMHLQPHTFKQYFVDIYYKTRL